jgi:two-component sensor histidine kinase
LKSAKALNKLSLFSKSITDLNIAIEIAHRNKWEEEFLESNVFLGEMMRRTQDHKKGVKILRRLKNVDKYPKTNAKKMSRLSALYAEWDVLYHESKKDSSLYYLNKGLKIAKNNNLLEEEAGLLNLLGFEKLSSGNSKDAFVDFTKAADIFKNLNNMDNYTLVMCHIMGIHLKNKDFLKCDEIKSELLKIIANTNWYGTQRTLFEKISDRYLQSGDSINYYKWLVKEKHAVLEYHKQESNNMMSNLRVKYDTNSFKNQASIAVNDSKLKTINLSEEKSLNNRLTFFISVFVLLSIVVLLLLFNKNKLAKSLDESNKKFELLMVESNHRIKNNLQMILSMIDYSEDNSDKQQVKTLNKISGKIQTVGVLHNHLYADLHNQFVNVELYFNEIIHLYSKMNPLNLIVESNVQPVNIESERIVYFGLILNEMLANTLEHNKSELKNVNIEIIQVDKKFQYVYSDNSPHLNENKLNRGGVLLNQLVKRIKAENFELNQNTGTYKFIFKDVE